MHVVLCGMFAVPILGRGARLLTIVVPACACVGKSLYFDEHRPPPGALPFDAVLWLRPSQFCKKPALFTGARSECDVVQGSLGDCWFMSALSVVASRKGMMEGVFVRTGQEAKGRCVGVQFVCVFVCLCLCVCVCA
jgi:hypothetical protein